MSTTPPEMPLPSPFQPTWESLKNYEIPEWYQDAKFGIFIHWGVYSVPAFGDEWYPRNMYLEGSTVYKHHIATYGPQTKFGYKDFIPSLTADKFKPSEWAQLFKQAGAKFVVPVAEHHDGFQMYDSALSDWNAAKMGPKRDIIGELASAVRDEGLTFGVSCHRAEHWWFYGGGWTFPSDVQDPQYQDFYGPARSDNVQPDQAFLDNWLARISELVDKYQPQVFYFDWWIEQPAFASYLQRFAAFYYNRAAEWGKGVAINYKYDAFPEGAAVLDLERGQLADIRKLFWQSDTSVSNQSWGYIKGDNFKNPTDIVHSLVDIVSKNGALLLNIGPLPDGTIDPHASEILVAIGQWLAVNGAAIYGSRPWRVFGEGPTEVAGGAFVDNTPPFTSEDIRFTVNDGALFAVALAWPDSGVLTVRSLGTLLRLYNGTVKKVTMLGDDTTPLVWQRDGSGLMVTLPSRPDGAITCAVKIEGDGSLDGPEDSQQLGRPHRSITLGTDRPQP